MEDEQNIWDQNCQILATLRNCSWELFMKTTSAGWITISVLQRAHFHLKCFWLIIENHKIKSAFADTRSFNDEVQVYSLNTNSTPAIMRVVLLDCVPCHFGPKVAIKSQKEQHVSCVCGRSLLSPSSSSERYGMCYV